MLDLVIAAIIGGVIGFILTVVVFLIWFARNLANRL